MDRLKCMLVFVKVTDCGSFAAASEVLNLSPQMVGKQISMLEEHLGTRLLNRTTRRQNLTEVGRIFYERCKIVLAEADAAESAAQDMTAMPRGMLRVNAPVTFGAYSLPPLVNDYMRRYPDVQVELTLSDRFVDLVDEGFEAVIRIGPLADSALIARKLKPYQLIACASPGYLAEYGTPAQPEDLLDHECLGYTYWSRPSEKEWIFTKGGKQYAAKVNSRLQSNNATALLSAALSGGGIILGAEVVLRSYIASGLLTQILADYQAPSREMHLLYSPNRYPTQKLRCFIDAVMAEYG
ncbi:LysR family transcriptional regulator [Serratia fonticola]|uniref:LysR family transcriptional regulator n=1 Tax=Serratia fonticola TaxID=47917 RepID=A0AAJ2DB61_SERFO|nr:LysR family transcriptional regulator [Serratia fonticola]MDQ9128874.1 LysR family transcriptional regulator [Serratia fonticola]